MKFSLLYKRILAKYGSNSSAMQTHMTKCCVGACSQSSILSYVDIGRTLDMNNLTANGVPHLLEHPFKKYPSLRSVNYEWYG